jgi:hypothetical protein
MKVDEISHEHYKERESQRSWRLGLPSRRHNSDVPH